MDIRPTRPNSRDGFEIAIICALVLEADAVEALFDHFWDDDDDDDNNKGHSFDKVNGDMNSYSTVVGVAGIVPFGPGGEEIVLGDIIISDGVIQSDFGRRIPEGFIRKDTLLDNLGRPNTEIRSVLAKLKTFRGRKSLRDNILIHLASIKQESLLEAEYPGTKYDILFDPEYRHLNDTEPCDRAGCNGQTMIRRRLETTEDVFPVVHFGLIACGDCVMKSGLDRDIFASAEGVIAFEMEGSGVWDEFPCVIIKSGCNYADSHETHKWEKYAAATAAACMKAFLKTWVPTMKAADPDAVPIIYTVPYTRNPEFVGRQDILTQLKNQLGQSNIADSNSIQSRLALIGLGGVGKTQIALAYTYWHRENLPNESIFWVHASNSEQFRQSYAKIAIEFQVPGYKKTDADLMMLAKDLLTQPKHGRWLLVIDNADDMELFFNHQQDNDSTSIEQKKETAFAHYLPECTHGNILITTRNKQVGFRLTKGQPPIDTSAMSEIESLDLLSMRLMNIEATPTELSILSSRLEYLPLALVQSAAFIHETSISVNKYLQLLDQNNTSIVNLLSKEFKTTGRDSNTPTAVAQTWMVSFRQIEKQHALAGNLLSLMSIFDRQDIPPEFLSHYCIDSGNGGTQSDLDIIEATGVLKAFSFVTERPSGGFDMHRLVQLVTRKWLINKTRIHEFWRQGLFTVSDLLPANSDEMLQTWSSYFPHVKATLSVDEPITGQEKKIKTNLLNRVAAMLRFRGDIMEAETFGAEATDMASLVYEADDPIMLAIKINRALIVRSQGRWKEATETFQQLMEKSKAKLGQDHSLTIVIGSNLASTLCDQGRWKEAEEQFLQLIEISKANSNPDHSSMLQLMNNLATTLNFQRRYEAAEKIALEVLGIQTEVLGSDHRQTLDTAVTLNEALWGQGKREEATKLNQELVKRLKTKFGPDNLRTLESVTNLAVIYHYDGRLQEAEELLREVIEIMSVKFGSENHSTLTIMSKLAHVLYHQGRWDDAEKLGREVMELRKTKLGLDHPDTLETMKDMARRYDEQNEWEDAEKMEMEILEILHRKFGSNYDETLSTMTSLSVLYQKQGKYKESEEL